MTIFRAFIPLAREAIMGDLQIDFRVQYVQVTGRRSIGGGDFILLAGVLQPYRLADQQDGR